MRKAGQGVDRGEPFCTTAGDVNCCAPLWEAYEGPQVLKMELHVTQQFHFWVRIWRKWNHYVKEDICNNKSNKGRQMWYDLTYICVETKIILNELIDKETSLWPDSKVGELDEGGQKIQTSIYKTMCGAVLRSSAVSDSATPLTAAGHAPLAMGILQARTLEWVAMPSSRGSSSPRDQTQVSCIAGRFFTVWATRKVQEYWSLFLLHTISVLYWAHLCMKCSLGIDNFLEEIVNLSHSIFCPLFLCTDHWGRLSYLSLLLFGTLHSSGYLFPYLLFLLKTTITEN